MRICEGSVFGYRDRGEVVRNLQGQSLLLPFLSEQLFARAPRERLCRFRRFRNEVELVEDILKQRPKRFFERANAFEAGEVRNITTGPTLVRWHLQHLIDEDSSNPD